MSQVAVASIELMEKCVAKGGKGGVAYNIGRQVSAPYITNNYNRVTQERTSSLISCRTRS